MPEYAANDDVAISLRLKEFNLIKQHRCFGKHNLPTARCWCYMAGSNGQTLSCSEACPESDFT